MDEQQQTEQRQKSDSRGLWLGLQLVWELGYIIAVPVVLFGFGGAYMDKYFGTSPFFILLGFVLAALISTYAAKKRVTAILSTQK